MKRKIAHLPENWRSKRKLTGLGLGSGFIAVLVLPVSIANIARWIAGFWAESHGQSLTFLIALGVSTLLLAPLIYARVVGSERKVKVYRDGQAIFEVRYTPDLNNWEVRQPTHYGDDEDAYFIPGSRTDSFPRSSVTEILERYEEVNVLESDLAAEAIRDRLVLGTMKPVKS